MTLSPQQLKNKRSLSEFPNIAMIYTFHLFKTLSTYFSQSFFRNSELGFEARTDFQLPVDTFVFDCPSNVLIHI